MTNVISIELDPALTAALERRALLRGVSVEEEVREILRHAVREAPMTEYGLGTRMAARFAGIGLDTPLPEIRQAFTDRFPL